MEYQTQLHYILYALRSTSSSALKGRCLHRSTSVSKSPEDPRCFCKRLSGNEDLNNNPEMFFTRDIATNESPGVKSTSPRSITALSNVKP